MRMTTGSAQLLRRPAVERSAPDSLRLAAIDAGSNSIHMIIAQADWDGGLTTLWRMKEMVGLGRMSFPSRKLSKESMDRAVATLHRFQLAAQQRQAEKIVAVATSAVREAENGGDFIERVKRELGMYIRVVSDREEARLIYLAVRHAMPLGDKPHFIFDLGGGSLELIVGDDQNASILESRKLGAARMTAKFVKSDPVSGDELKALLRHYDRELGPLCEQIAALKPIRAIGTSGTLENLAAICGTQFSNGHGEVRVIERDALERLLHRLVESRAKDRAKIRGLDPQRQDQIMAGALLVGQIFRRLDLKRVYLCGAALREGILLDYLSRHIPELRIRREVPDPQRRSVLDLARRCHWHQRHSEQVARLCMQLFDQLRPLHGLGREERNLIEYGALLHDIGWHIGRSGHHKHSAYLILHGDLKAFSDEQIKIIANIARYHRKSTPKVKHVEYQMLSPAARRIVDVGAALLRIADGLDRSHSSAVESVRCRILKRGVVCKVNARSDAELEIWGARRKRDFFEQVFRCSITVEPKA